MNEQELLELKQSIENAKSDLSELQGRRKSLMEQLEDDWDCHSVEDAEAKVDELLTELDEVNHAIQEGVQEIQKELNDEDDS